MKAILTGIAVSANLHRVTAGSAMGHERVRHPASE